MRYGQQSKKQKVKVRHEYAGRVGHPAADSPGRSPGLAGAAEVGRKQV